MDFLPLFFNLRGKPCLLVGGGGIALRKARLLVKAQALVTVVAPTISPELEALVQSNGGQCLYKPYEPKDLEAPILVIAATDIEPVNQKISADCHARKIPVNVVDNPALCSVIMPAIVDRSPLIIGITSGGEAPVLARMVRSKLEILFPGAYGELAKLASKFRMRIKNRFEDTEKRRRFWESTLAGPVSEKALAGDMAGAEKALNRALEAVDDSFDGEVYLVGAGPGDPDLLTFKALRLMQKAEVVLYDRLVSEPILDMVRRDADRIYVGKRKADHALPQTEINQLLVKLAQEGKRVLRLKGGDPFIFGRGGEEIELLAKHNIPFQVVPGITAAAGCASYAGIPLTHRDHAQSVRFVTGHLKNGTTDLAWHDLASQDQTLVFYMGLTGVNTICQELIAHGKPGDTPVAVVSKGTLPTQTVHVSTLKHLPDELRINPVPAPTLIIVGGVVSLHHTLKWYRG